MLIKVMQQPQPLHHGVILSHIIANFLNLYSSSVGELTAAFGNAVVIADDLQSGDGKKITDVKHFLKHEIITTKKCNDFAFICSFAFFSLIQQLVLSFSLLMFLFLQQHSNRFLISFELRTRQVNRFFSNAPFLYPLNTPENRKIL